MRRGSLLRRQPHAPRADQAGIGRLETPEGPARCSLEVNVLVVGAAKSEVGGCGVAIRNRDETEDDAARIDFDNAAKTKHLSPQIALHVIMDAVGGAAPWHIGA